MQMSGPGGWHKSPRAAVIGLHECHMQGEAPGLQTGKSRSESVLDVPPLPSSEAGVGALWFGELGLVRGLASCGGQGPVTSAGSRGVGLRSLLASQVPRVRSGWQGALHRARAGLVVPSPLCFWPQQKHPLINTLQRAPALWKFEMSQSHLQLGLLKSHFKTARLSARSRSGLGAQGHGPWR